MQQAVSSSKRVRRAIVLVALIALACACGCADSEEERPGSYRYDATPVSDAVVIDPCTLPNQGCPCESPGEVRDCGKIVVNVDGYETCYDGSRICSDAGTWSACAADQTIVQQLN